MFCQFRRADFLPSATLMDASFNVRRTCHSGCREVEARWAASEAVLSVHSWPQALLACCRVSSGLRPRVWPLRLRMVVSWRPCCRACQQPFWSVSKGWSTVWPHPSPLAHYLLVTFGMFTYMCTSVQLSRSVVSDSLQPHEPQHARPPCPSPTPGVHPNPCPLSW